jgi:hypothetical protein
LFGRVNDPIPGCTSLIVVDHRDLVNDHAHFPLWQFLIFSINDVNVGRAREGSPNFSETVIVAQVCNLF